MDIFEAIEQRRSIRSYRPDEVPVDMIKSILHAGHMAPSAGNLQGREFIIVRDSKTREKVYEHALRQPFIKEAPCCIIACANIERSSSKYGSRGDLYAVQDATAAVMNMMLEAHNLGLGTCWVGAFNEKGIVDLFSLPYGIRPVAIMPLGYPDEQPYAPPRLNEKIEHWDGW